MLKHCHKGLEQHKRMLACLQPLSLNRSGRCLALHTRRCVAVPNQLLMPSGSRQPHPSQPPQPQQVPGRGAGCPASCQLGLRRLWRQRRQGGGLCCAWQRQRLRQL